MQADPVYDDVVSEVKAFLEERLAFAVAAGIPEEHVCLDPGIGFGKTVEHNLELVRRLDELVAIGRPVRRRLLAQEHARPDPGRPGRDDRHDSRRRSARRSRRSTAARRSCASTTFASTSRRCASPRSVAG